MMRSFIQKIKENLGIEKSHHILLWIHLLMLQTKIDLFLFWMQNHVKKITKVAKFFIFIEMLGVLGGPAAGQVLHQ